MKMLTKAIIVITHVYFLLPAFAFASESGDTHESTVTGSTVTASSRTVEEETQSAGRSDSAGDSEGVGSVPRGTVFLIVSTPADREDDNLGVVGALSYANPRSTDTLLDHYRLVNGGRARYGRQSCPTKESVWTVLPKDTLTVHKDATGRVVCAEGKSYAIGKVERVTSGSRTVQVLVAEGTLLDKNVAHGARGGDPEILLTPSKNVLGKTQRGANSLHRPPQMKRGESVALICPQEEAPLIALQTDYASLPEEDFPARATPVQVLIAWPTQLDGTGDSSDADVNAARVVVQPLAKSQALSPSQPVLLTLDMSNGKTRKEHKSFFLDAGVQCQLSAKPLRRGRQHTISLHCVGARRRRRKRGSMTSMPVVDIAANVAKKLDRVLNFLTYGTVIASSAILAGHGLLAFDPNGSAAMLSRMVGEQYIGSKYNFLQFFISAEQIGNYFRAGSWDNLRILARHVGKGEHVQAALGYIISGVGVKTVNLIFPLFLLFIAAYILNRPLLWPVQKLYEYNKRKSDVASAAVATRATVEVRSLCPPKRVILKCVDFEEQLQMIE